MSMNTYIKGGINILHHVADVGLMFGDELEYFPVLDVEWPVSEPLNIALPHFVNCQEVFVMFFVPLKKASLANQPGWLFAVGQNAEIDYFLAFVPSQQTLWSNRPFYFMTLTA